MQIALNPAHDIDVLSRSYAERRRIQVRDFFTEAAAEAVLAELYGLPWHLAFNEGQTVHQLTPEQLSRLSGQEAARIQQVVNQGARSGYQFLYNHFPVYAEYFGAPNRERPIFSLYEFINSPVMLDFLRKLTGLDDIVWADCHATLYRAGHFLKFHTDENPREQRLAAYVLNFTKNWGRDWGGLLQFWNKEFDVEHAYRPVFNALNIFTIPADHSVSAVPAYCEGLRFSVTGWLRGDQPPGPIGR